MATALKKIATAIGVGICAALAKPTGSHAMATAALGYRETMSLAIEMPSSRRRFQCDDSLPQALTGKQKLALMLANAGYSHATIAGKLGLRHRVSATKLIARARLAHAKFCAAVEDFLDS